MNSKIMFFWGLTIVLICSTLIVMGNMQKDKTLLKMERNIKTSARDYLLDNDLLPKYNESYIITVEELLDNNYLRKTKSLDTYCAKSVKVTRKIIFNDYEINMKCEEVIKNE